MVARKLLVRHENSTFDIDYDTDDGLEVFKFQLFSLTSIPPDEQKIVCDDDHHDIKIICDDSDLNSIEEKVRLISIEEDVVAESSATGDSHVNEELLKSDEEFARLLQAEEEALLFQQYVAPEDNGQIEEQLRGYIDKVFMYEDPTRQEAARKTVPVDELEEKSLVAIAKKEGNFEPTKDERDHAFLLELLIWFKQSFSWVNAPPCDSCGNQTIGQGMGVPSPAEMKYGGSRVELYRCSFCSRITRFPRYNDPIKILETKKGRCGEWANCFTLYCRAFGYESRPVLDFTDHVWTECFSHHLGRWMHLDPCEGIYDNPLLYEKGWNKKLNYVIAIAKDGVYDVTKRYTRKWHEVLTRRNITTEQNLCNDLEKLTKQCRKGLKPEEISLLEERYKIEKEAIERDLHSKGDAAVSLPGRLSGDKQWRISRSEYESGKDGLSCTTCPVRLCVDEHVSDIYNSLGVVISQFADSSLSVSSGVDALKTLRRILTDCQKCPFRSRKIINTSHGLQPSLHHLLPAFGKLMNTLYLKFELDTKNEVLVHMVGHPIKTSLALPVALDALDDMIVSLAKCPSISKDCLSLPLLRLNRIHSGSVLASGEELPFGIATSAFDGLQSSKWEEPNGARGGWIAYKLKEEQMCEVVAYELMSANDAPERDPMNWIVEGSSDGGSSWYVLDRQTSQTFDSRFQCKLYRVGTRHTLSNAIRFTFLSVRDVKSTSRLQIGSIDLYAGNY
ncbi:peptide-N(4)-(N-acetyl-beta-glucosaminyl)asparagine amidase-like [Chenopodium quinoa]|uniref:peptide-N(4)-(N-acetyl-beta- glucosaminyl)asparagine amidase-like n=1 Tax=Chenopodium quinoa TaxID=63459 RepID=UPI000B77A43C|nr:peptide-N(4)-(N-acetyl-beta-glucosaminyl)asparagine amidase-like [Chenopodium quinoa]